MGLETVEFVMEVEQEFGISIPDSEAEKITTVGEFVVMSIPFCRRLKKRN